MWPRVLREGRGARGVSKLITVRSQPAKHAYQMLSILRGRYRLWESLKEYNAEALFQKDNIK